MSTVVDRNFAENLPMNGRSFQTLIELTPGVVLTAVNAGDNGQFSVNGQRASSNYWMVDGVSANIGVSGFAGGGGFAGATASFSAQGGTNSLVSVDAMQEFRIQTSTYSPEFGRTPGGQISILTRSGTNQFHGTAFDYLRNDAFDANDWFADFAKLPKAEERQNDFGGTFGGPIVKNRTFFFFSYEGLRLDLPETALTTVPDAAARQSAAAAIQPFLNAYPRPNGADLGNGTAEFNASFANSSTLDAYSIRLDHRISDKLTLFARYSDSPSQLFGRGQNGASLNNLSPTSITTETATIGSIQLFSPRLINDLRLNYSRTTAASSFFMDNFGGAVPLEKLPLPAPFTAQDASFNFSIFSLEQGSYDVGQNGRNIQHQWNLVDSLSYQEGTHGLKFGVDFRRLTPTENDPQYGQGVAFDDVVSAQTGNLFDSFLISDRAATLLFRNLGVYGQDTWHPVERLTLTYGLRWDVDFAPESLNGPNIPAVTSFAGLQNLSLTLASPGTPPFHTPIPNFAPRLGVAYQLRQNTNWQSVLRGGVGVFYDLATSEAGNLIVQSAYPFGTFQFNFGGTFPLAPDQIAPPPIVPPGAGAGEFIAFYPHLQLPYTMQWNAAFEQSLGTQQVISASYIGSEGKRLLQSANVLYPDATPYALVVGNSASSDYNALQLQFRRHLQRGLQALVSYTWSHSTDDGSAGSFENAANFLTPGISASTNRGPSDFDIRNAASAALTYDVPATNINALMDAILHHWSLESIIQARSAIPVNVIDGNFFQLLTGATAIRPDVVPGQPFYLHGSQYPGDLALNPAAFVAPPIDINGFALRQGDLGRNALRGFGAFQWDMAIHRTFPLTEVLKLQLRAEFFNILNHPNFAPPISDISNPEFGRSNEMLGQYLSGSGGAVGFGGFSPLYQIGGPRSIQLALKLSF